MLVQDAEDDSAALLGEINATRQHHLDISALRDANTFKGRSIEHTVPHQDETYRNLGNSLIVHTRIANMFLLRFITFDGLEAYQPCSRDIDLLNLSKSLRHIESADPTFSAARDWSCILQALPGLPKEVRWVLSIIYNFACVMLRPTLDEESHWFMRPWLMHWYDVADGLFLKYGIPATAPDPNWCSRPRESFEDLVRPAQHNTAEDSRQSPSAGAAADHSSPISSLVQDSEEDNATVELINIPVGHPSELFEFGNDRRLRLFDPTPGGLVFSQREPPVSVSSGSVMGLSFPFDPSVTVFVPQV
jgi:hypothetical protein